MNLPKKKNGRWGPVDVMVAALTMTICAILVVTVLNQMVTGEEATEAKQKMITGLITSTISIVSMYVGAQLQKRNDKDE